jgi:hypothetical protein
VVLRDEVSGETCEVRPRIVVNATGARIDLTNRGLGRESRFIGGTKGSHIVLDHPELLKAAGDGMIYFVDRDGRICIFYGVQGKIVAGATDIPADDPETVCDEAEVDYILEAMRLAFPSIRVDRSHVVFRFCGVRPLPRSDALTPGQISRDHGFPVLAPGPGPLADHGQNREHQRHRIRVRQRHEVFLCCWNGDCCALWGAGAGTGWLLRIVRRGGGRCVGPFSSGKIVLHPSWRPISRLEKLESR